MQVFRSQEDQITKYIHKDGSETCIKTIPSVDGRLDSKTGIVSELKEDRNKVSVFLSASKGCPMNCTFCSLTVNAVSFARLDTKQVLENVWAAILKENETVILADRYIKICWMGMGEAILNPAMIKTVTLTLMDRIMETGLAKGLDGMDISTVLPKINSGWIDVLVDLNTRLAAYPRNPAQKNKNRSPLRLFYSLHSAIEETRNGIIPGALPIAKAIDQMKMASQAGLDVIVHHMFLDGINDSDTEIAALKTLMQTELPNSELRVLRFNAHERSEIRESVRFDACIAALCGNIDQLKVQSSYGYDVKSACGQFIAGDVEALAERRVAA